MKLASFVLVSLSVALAAACGGKGKGAAPPSPGGEGDDPATPFQAAAVKAAIRSSPGVDACSADPSSTMGAHFDAQRALLKGEDGAFPLRESFMCRAQPDDSWACEWSLFTIAAAPAEPDLDAEGEGEAEAEGEGEGEGEGSGYIIMVTVKSNGTLVPGTIACNAPG